MPSPAEGEYLIINVRNQTLALDVSGANRSNGANVQLWNILNNRAQLFTVKYNEDGSARILASFTGKSVDVNGGNIQNGTNIQQWTNNDTRAQKWRITATGNTVTFRNKQYPTYKVQLDYDTTYVMDVAGTNPSAGSNCLLYKDDGGTDQHWIFLPRPKLHSGGVYEIHSMVNPKYAIDITSWSKTDGAQAILWPSHSGNNQKFILTEETTDMWSVRNVHSNKFFDIKGNVAKNGAVVVQWGDPVNPRHQRWKILERDSNTVEYNGVECTVVSFGAYGTESDGNTFMLHSYNSLASERNIINIWEDAGGNGYRWLLYPTDAEDPNMPTPYDLGLSDVRGRQGTTAVFSSETLYPVWSCTDAWATDGPNHYEVRFRNRYMSPFTSSWGEWGEWGAWTVAAVEIDGKKAIMDPIDGTFLLTDAKAMQIEYQVRSVGVGSTAMLHSKAVSYTATVHYAPQLDMTQCGWSPDGLLISYTSDYTAGSLSFMVESCTVDGAEALQAPFYADGLAKDGHLSIPCFIAAQNGSEVSVRYRVGTDQLPASYGRIRQEELTLVFDSGADVAPSISGGEHMVATVAYEGARMWMRTEYGVIKLDPVDASGSTSFNVPFPFGKPFALFTSVDGDTWGTDYREMPVQNAKPCHSWLIDGSFLDIVYNKDRDDDTATVTAEHENLMLSGREWGSVGFSGTKNMQTTYSGALLNGISEHVWEDVEAIVGRHGVYRSPYGPVHPVAVIGAEKSMNEVVASVKITHVREG